MFEINIIFNILLSKGGLNPVYLKVVGREESTVDLHGKKKEKGKKRKRIKLTCYFSSTEKC